MKKIRAILSLLFTLILGFLLGFFVSQEIVRHRVKDVESLSSYESFKTRLYAIIEPNEEQIQQIEPVIEQFSDKMEALKKSFRSEYGKIIQDFHNELKPFLNAEQVGKLDQFPKYFGRKHRNHAQDSIRK